MARERTLRIGAINIRVHTKHAPDEYYALWRSIYKLKQVKTRGVTAMMIGGMRQIDPEAGEMSPIFGYLYRFINIDPSERWFDIEKQEPAEEDDVARSVRIPAHLKPNLREIPYLFDVKKHQLYVQTGGAGDSVSVRLVDGLLEHLFAFPQIIMAFGEINHTVVAQAGLVEELLQWPEIRYIRVELERPNPNDFDDDQRYEERMKRRAVSKERHEFFKAKGEDSIQPDGEMIDMFKRSTTDGVYVQRGVNAELHVETVSSRDRPREEIELYDPDLQTHSDAFIEAALRKFR